MEFESTPTMIMAQLFIANESDLNNMHQIDWNLRMSGSGMKYVDQPQRICYLAR